LEIGSSEEFSVGVQPSRPGKRGRLMDGALTQIEHGVSLGAISTEKHSDSFWRENSNPLSTRTCERNKTLYLNLTLQHPGILDPNLAILERVESQSPDLESCLQREMHPLDQQNIDNS
jgi:hypothetical protein